MSQVVIHCEQLGKRYQIGQRERYLALRDVLANSFQAPWRLFGSAAPGSSNGRPKHIWAMRNVSFEIHEGEVVGIVGRNGAGKTTLLKVLARVTKPTEGHAEVVGRMGSLLEVGTGFHPELTGRENTYLSGAILGMSKREINRKFDEIVAFAEVEQFIDTPLKHYSSGMQMRLAFAVAAHLEPEILLVDEVLAVGDIAFQKKCLGKMGEVARGGRTILFVSHNMGAIAQLCQRCLLLVDGHLALDDAPERVVSAHVKNSLQPSSEGETTWERSGSGRARITSVAIRDELGAQCSTLSMGQNLYIRIGGCAERSDLEFTLAAQFVTCWGIPVLYLYNQFKNFRSGADKSFLIDVFVPRLLLMPGLYFLHVWVGLSGQEEFDYVKNGATIDVIQSDCVPITLPIHQHLGLVYSYVEAQQLR